MSKIIVVDGPDRVGKFTQTNMLADHLRKQGFDVALIEVPITGTVTHKLIYWMLSNERAIIHPNIFQFLQFLNRAIFQIKTLWKLELENDFIIFDRWTMSSAVYGEASGASDFFSKTLSRLLKKPDVTVVLLGDQQDDVATDTYEADKILQLEIRTLYDEASNAPDCVKVNCNGTRLGVHKSILKSLVGIGIIEGEII